MYCDDRQQKSAAPFKIFSDDDKPVENKKAPFAIFSDENAQADKENAPVSKPKLGLRPKEDFPVNEDKENQPPKGLYKILSWRRRIVMTK